MKNLIFLFLIIFSTSAFAQNTNANERIINYAKGQNFQTIKPFIEDFEALVARNGLTFLRTGTERDYTMTWYRKHNDGNLLEIRIRYQFFIQFFKINIESIRLIFPDSKVVYITSDAKEEPIIAQYNTVTKLFFDYFINSLSSIDLNNQ